MANKSRESKKNADNLTLNEVAQQFSNMPIDNVMSAFQTSGMYNAFTSNPIIQNTRMKRISSMPVGYGKDQIAEFLSNPNNSERPLRESAHALEVSAYPYWKIRKLYSDLLTYKNYTYPAYFEKNASKKDEFMREWRLAEKIRETINPALTAHELVGQAVQEGKVFYQARTSIDRAHNKVNYSFVQQLPSDWTKIVGYNNVTGYTIAFNMMYFMTPGTTVSQFGNLFEPYIGEFFGAVEKPDTRTVYASKSSRINLSKVRECNEIKAYKQNGVWFYWVTLPADSVWTFEIDDVNRNVFSPLTGLMLAMTQIADYENIQLQLVQNPLISVVLGTIPYRDEKTVSEDDPYKMSPKQRELFIYLWYQMLEKNSTSGIGFFPAPVENMRLEQLAEAPNATEISSNGYAYTIAKSGLAAILPSTTDNRAGVANISLLTESQYGKQIYRTFERMMNWIYASLGLRYEFKFKMFGSLAEDEKDLKTCKEGMTLGILSDTLRYLALRDLSLLDDLSIANAVVDSGIMDTRLPLVSTYSAKAPDSGLPPQPKGKTGRPQSEEISSEGKEGDADSPNEQKANPATAV